MCIRDSLYPFNADGAEKLGMPVDERRHIARRGRLANAVGPVSYTHLRAHETVLDLVCRLLLEKKNTAQPNSQVIYPTGQ